MLQKDELFRVLIIGNSCSGKTSLLNRYTKNDFSKLYTPTHGVEFQKKLLPRRHSPQQSRVIQFWDTSGQEILRKMLKTYYQGADAVVLVYDASDQGSFGALEGWVKDVEQYCDSSIRRALVANKIDQTNLRMVDTSKGMMIAEQIHARYYGMVISQPNREFSKEEY